MIQENILNFRTQLTQHLQAQAKTKMNNFADNPDTSTPIFYKPTDTSESKFYQPRNTSNMKGPKHRDSVEECFWLYATEEAKQGKVLEIVNKALRGNLNFHSYQDYRRWIKGALQVA